MKEQSRDKVELMVERGAVVLLHSILLNAIVTTTFANGKAQTPPFFVMWPFKT